MSDLGVAQGGVTGEWRAAASAARRGRSAQAYRAAVSHSRRVRWLRRLIPVGAVLSFAAFVVWPFIDPFRAAGVSVGAVRMDGTRITMENPRLAGHRKDARPYEVTADSATQDIRTPTLITLHRMRATLVNSDDGVLTVLAENALFDSERERMRMSDKVTVRTQNGQEADLVSADVDFKAGTLTSRDPVVIRLPEMRVSAGSLDIAGHGARVTFVGRVSAEIDPARANPASARPAP
jgi:lipopolysaccharide export system protein LptC